MKVRGITREQKEGNYSMMRKSKDEDLPVLCKEGVLDWMKSDNLFEEVVEVITSLSVREVSERGVAAKEFSDWQ